MKTIVFLNPKGGAGKSTTSVSLANTLAYYYGQTVMLVSTDNQQTSPNLRKDDELEYGESDDYYEVFGTNTQFFLDNVLPDKENLEKEGLDFLIVDTPGYVDPNTFLIAKQADLVLIPVKLSRIDLKDFTKDTVGIVKQELFTNGVDMYETTYWFPNEMDKKTSAYRDYQDTPEAFEYGIKRMPGVLKRENFKYLDTVSFPDEKDNSIRPLLIEMADNILDRLSIQLEKPVTQTEE